MMRGGRAACTTGPRPGGAGPVYGHHVRIRNGNPYHDHTHHHVMENRSLYGLHLSFFYRASGRKIKKSTRGCVWTCKGTIERSHLNYGHNPCCPPLCRAGQEGRSLCTPGAVTRALSHEQMCYPRIRLPSLCLNEQLLIQGKPCLRKSQSEQSPQLPERKRRQPYCSTNSPSSPGGGGLRRAGCPQADRLAPR